MSTVVRLSESQVEKLGKYQALRVKQLELLANEKTDARAFRSFSNWIKGMSLGEVLTSALDYAIEALEADIDSLSVLAAEDIPEIKPRTKKASK